VAEAEDHENAYLFYISSKVVLDPTVGKLPFAAYANDARGLAREAHLSNNAEYIVEGQRCFIDARKDIQKGEEILVGYGWEYWKVIRDELKKKSPAKKHHPKRK
jgi:SET domain-containing protein